MCRAATAVAQRHGGGLRDPPRTVIQAFRIEEEPLRARNVRLEVSAKAGRTTPALAWDRRPVPSSAPPQPRRGIEMSKRQAKGFAPQRSDFEKPEAPARVSRNYPRRRFGLSDFAETRTKFSL